MSAYSDKSIKAWPALRDFWLAAPVATMSGGVMMVAGYLLRNVGPGTASLATLPGGVMIVVAFATIRRRWPSRPPGTSATHALHRARAALLVLREFGLPDDLSLRARVVVLSLTLIAGAVMVFAGYTIAAHGWELALAPALTGGLLISAAFATVARAPGRDWR